MGIISLQDASPRLLGATLFALLLGIAGLVVRVWLLGAILVSISSRSTIRHPLTKAIKDAKKRRFGGPLSAG
jgi:hypothetical protein